MQECSLQHAYTVFILDAKARGLRSASLDTYTRQVRQFLVFAADLDITHLTQIDTTILRAYIAHLQGRGLRPSSIRTAGRVLRVWLNFCAADGMVTETPMRRVRMPRQDRPRPDAFTRQDVAALLDAARSARDRAIVLCLLDSGCRVGEFTAWRIGDVDTAAGAVTIRHETTKSRTQRTVFLGQHARRELASYIANHPTVDTFVWRTRDGARPLSVGGMQHAIQRIGKRAGIAPAGPHKYRRTFAVHALRSGMDLYSVADILGHGTIDLLKHYIHQDDAALAASHARYGPVDGMLNDP